MADNDDKRCAECRRLAYFWDYVANRWLCRTHHANCQACASAHPVLSSGQHIKTTANSDILRLASEANAARDAYDSAICKSLTGVIYGRRLIQAVDALTAAIADQAAREIGDPTK